MRIYTRTGDTGQTGLFGGGRVAKDHVRVDAYGEVDELNSAIGVARSTVPAELFDAELEAVQRDLFALGGHLATPDPAKVRAALEKAELSAARIAGFEGAMDAADQELPPLRAFILPAGTAKAAALHLARTVCRRAERAGGGLARAGRGGPGPPSAPRLHSPGRHREGRGAPPRPHGLPPGRAGGGRARPRERSPGALSGLSQPPLRLPLHPRPPRQPPRRPRRSDLVAVEPAATVTHGAGSYPVFVEPGLGARLPALAAELLPGRRLAVITDRTVGRAVPHGIDAPTLVVAPGEGSKTRARWSALTDRLLDLGS